MDFDVGTVEDWEALLLDVRAEREEGAGGGRGGDEEVEAGGAADGLSECGGEPLGVVLGEGGSCAGGDVAGGVTRGGVRGVRVSVGSGEHGVIGESCEGGLELAVRSHARGRELVRDATASVVAILVRCGGAGRARP